MIASWEAWNSELQINVFELVRLQKSILYTYIHISTWSYENRVSKHFVIFLNFPWLIALFRVCVEVDVDRITMFPPSLFFPLPTILSLSQVTAISLKSIFKSEQLINIDMFISYLL